MAKHEFTPDEEKSVDEILNSLAGYTVEQAEAILKQVTTEIKNRAVIE